MGHRWVPPSPSAHAFGSGEVVGGGGEDLYVPKLSLRSPTSIPRLQSLTH